VDFLEVIELADKKRAIIVDIHKLATKDCIEASKSVLDAHEVRLAIFDSIQETSAQSLFYYSCFFETIAQPVAASLAQIRLPLSNIIS